MSYSNFVSRTDAGPLIPEDAADEIWKEATLASYVLASFKRRTMMRGQQRIPVLDTKATAYFVTGDTGLKQTTEINWINKFIDAEELAVIVVIPDNVEDDADFDIWEEHRTEVIEAIAKAIDEAVFFGTNAPASWPVNIEAAAIAAGNTEVEGTNAPDLGEDINQLMITVEQDGYAPSSHVLDVATKGLLRGLRTGDGAASAAMFLYPSEGPANVGLSNAGWKGTIYNLPSFVWKIGTTGFGAATGDAMLFTLDSDHFVWGMRKDIRMKKADSGVISDAAGNIVFNLFQQDAQALRFTLRGGWQVSNAVTRLQPTAALRYPAGVLTAA